jgi:endonuclease III
MRLEELRKAIKGSRNEKALHRFVNNVSSWIKAAAKKLVDEYRGDAENIWSDCRTAGEIIERLDEFKRVGKKKAHMAAAILRTYECPFTGFDQINMAVDVHVKRVWRRLGLVKTGDTREIHAKAAELHPEYPGALDAPTWLIGRAWCHAGNPDCHGARNEEPCPPSEELSHREAPEEALKRKDPQILGYLPRSSPASDQMP